ncbi:MAG: DNA polymerase I [Gemmataceae bacterium]|nr:DNA polymerase I [Gemmata sp.]MDW8199030.1 DNA polymerase I [Gemmataceae bacterium]
MSDPHTAGSLYLLDAHGLIFQMYYGVGRMTAPDGRPTNAVFGVTRALLTLYDRQPDYLLAAFDHPEPTFRTQIDPHYKAHRETPPDDLRTQEPMIHQVLEAMRIPLLMVPGYEADDIMATVATAAAERGLDVYLCTADKDCRQLVNARIKLLNLRKGYEVLDEAAIIADWGIRPDQVIDYQAIVGDNVDNIPGVKGVGPKTATKWLQQYGTLENLIAHADTAPGGPKVREALQQAIAKSDLLKSRQLVTLNRHVPITFDWDGWRRRDWDGPRLLELFHEFGFRRFAERVRKTLATHGAQKNAELLATAGISPPSTDVTSSLQSTNNEKSGRKDNSSPRPHAAATASPPHPPSPPLQPSLFDHDADAPAQVESPPPSDDHWSYAGYETIDTPEKFARFLQALKEQSAFVFDLETNGLNPLSDPIVGYAFAWEPQRAYYLPVRGPQTDAQLDPDTTLAALRPIFENPSIAKRNHNIKFDQIVLAAAGVRLAGVAGDSMIAHYLLHPGERGHGLDDLTLQDLHHKNIAIAELIGKGKSQIRMAQVPVTRVKDYACEDADAALQLAQLYEPQLEAAGLRRLYDEVEIPLISVLADMEFTGIRIDVPFLKKLSQEMTAELAAMEADIHRLAGRPFNIASLRELQKILFDEMKLPVQRRTGIKNEPSTDQESLERLAALGHELPKKLIDYRKLMKLKNTYVDVLPTMADARGRVHTSFNQAAVETGRLSSSDPNLQNIPARTEQGAQLRRAFIPRSGWKLITADYSQIELRMLAHFCGDETLRRAFIEDRDVHTAVAAQIFKVPEAAVSKTQRALAKTVNFGVLYGMSAMGLSMRLSIPKKEAEEFIDAYFARYPKVLEYQQRLLAKAHTTGEVHTLLGRKRRLNPEAINPQSRYQNRGAAEREAINYEIQGSAADLMKRAMLAVSRQLSARHLQAKMLLTVHDELVFEAPPKEVKTVVQLARDEMTAALELSVPLKVDVAVGRNWLDVEEV